MRAEPLSKLHVLLYGLNFEPELTGIGKYSGEMAHWLVAQGHTVQVVTAPPYYPEWSVRPGFSAMAYRAGDARPGLSVLRCPLWVPSKVTGLSRVLHLMTFALSSGPALLWAGLRSRPSVLMVVVPTLACVPVALFVARLLRVPAWLHVQDFEVDAMHSMGIVQGSGRAHRMVVAAESWLMRRFDRVSSISRNMVRRLHAKGLPPERTIEFPNWVDVSTIRPQGSPADNSNPVRAKFAVPPGAKVVLYAGNMGQKQGIEVVVDAARLLQDRQDIFFVLVGAGSAVTGLQRHAQGLENIRWLPLQPIELLNDLLNAADIHVLPQRADAADLVMPSKLTGMLASGRPVVGTADANTQLGMTLDACGVRVPPENATKLADAVDRLSRDEAQLKRLGVMGREHAMNHLSHTAILSAFEAELKRLVRATDCLLPDTEKTCEK